MFVFVFVAGYFNILEYKVHTPSLGVVSVPGNPQNMSQKPIMYIDPMMQVRLMRSVSIIPTCT